MHRLPVNTGFCDISWRVKEDGFQQVTVQEASAFDLGEKDEIPAGRIVSITLTACKLPKAHLHWLSGI